MNEKQLEYARQWVEKARHDLFVIDMMSEKETSPADIAAFHAQQVIEKVLKGFLTAKNIRFRRTHDLEELIDIALPLLPELAAWREKCALITQYAVDVRYPDSISEPTRQDIVQAREDAWGLFKILESAIGSEG
jgi:HEPN domain-containing protein